MTKLEELLKNTGLSFDQIKEALHEDGNAIVPLKPSLGRLGSMGLRHDHALFFKIPDNDSTDPMFGMISGHGEKSVKAVIRSMSQLYEEASGNGFYSEDREQFYLDGLAQFGILEIGDLYK